VPVRALALALALALDSWSGDAPSSAQQSINRASTTRSRAFFPLFEHALAMSAPTPSAGPQIHRLVGVYDADSTLIGEISYWVGARLGRKHCSLCDITHGSVRERSEWKVCRAELPVPFDTFHRNDQPEAIRSATEGQAPVVVAESEIGTTLLLAPSDLEMCGGSIDRLVEAIERAATRNGLDWPTT
jgi:hypothetical protein